MNISARLLAIGFSYAMILLCLSEFQDRGGNKHDVSANISLIAHDGTRWNSRHMIGTEHALLCFRSEQEYEMSVKSREIVRSFESSSGHFHLVFPAASSTNPKSLTVPISEREEYMHLDLPKAILIDKSGRASVRDLDL